MTALHAARPRRKTFRRGLFMFVAVQAGGAALLAVGLLALHGHMRTTLDRATSEFVTEQWIADEVSNAVMQQVLAASIYWQAPNPALEAEFRRAGDEAQNQIRRYLFRDLSTEERLQVEIVKEEHQRLEVAAARSIELAGRGREAEAAEAARSMAEHGLALQNATAAFLAMRETDLDVLRAEQSRAFRLLALAGAVFAMLISGGSLYWGRFLHRRLARPLTSLSEAATRIGDGELGARVPVPAEAELAAVAHSFNRMSDGLAAAHCDLEERNRELASTLEQLHATQAELVQTEKLSALGGMLAGLAHELNNPLAAVLGYGQLLDDHLEASPEPGAGEMRSEFVAPIVTEATRARNIVRNLLRFSRKPAPEAEAVPLAEVVELVAEIRRYAFEQAGLTLVIDPVPDVYVSAEPQRLQQALLNLVNNSFDAHISARAGDAGSGEEPRRSGTVRFRFERHDGQVDVIVEDDGPGFTEASRVFEPFYTTKPVGQGTGLGLTLVHRFMEECGGAVRAFNLPEGGARVVMTFREATPADGASEDPGEQERPGRRGALRVLVVEDESPLRNLQKRLLSRIGADVALAEGGDEAREILQTRDFDVVVSDVKMPNGNGLELYRWIERERPWLARRVLFVTGDVGDPQLAALADRRPEHFLDKPFHTDQYLSRVTALAGIDD